MDANAIELTASLEDRHWWYRERRNLLAREARKLPVGKAIELGAAGGGNSLLLKNLGWDVTATEYLEAGVEIALSRGLKAVQADARKLPFEDGSFDLLVAFDVLEHIEEDGLAAAEIFRVLKPGGTALIAVPCDMALWSGFDVVSGHFRRYTRETLTNLIGGAGLTIESLASWNVLLRPVVKFSRRNDDGKGEYDVEKVNPVLNFALGSIVWAERYLPVKSWPGVSLMMRATRPD